MKRPVRVEDTVFIVDADCELVCLTEGATAEELQEIVDALNAYQPAPTRASTGDQS